MLRTSHGGDDMTDIGRISTKIYSPEPAVVDDRFVPVFHKWIRSRAFGRLLIDVADYTHVPDGPGVMLVGHDITFSLDRSDGRFGLLAQRRRPFAGDAIEGVVTTLQALLAVADALERDVSEANLRLDRTRIRLEGNDRLRVPNTDLGFLNLEPIVATAVRRLFPDREIVIERSTNDPRERLAVDVLVRSER